MRPLAILFAVLMSGIVHASDFVEIDAFRFDRRAVGDAEWPAAERSLRRQVAIVTSSGVPAGVLAFFRTVPIVLEPGQNVRGGWYSNGRVLLPSAPIPEDRPVLLHELLHAYHYMVLGDESAQIRNAHAAALKSPLAQMYPGAHFLENPGEYFAVIGSIYLFGQIRQPPFTCTAIAGQQPEFLALLAQRFGPHKCAAAVSAPDEKAPRKRRVARP